MKKREIEQRPLEQIIPYARNPRKNEEAVSTVMASIKEFGAINAGWIAIKR